MIYRRKKMTFLVTGVGLMWTAAIGAAQSNKPLTAREIFYAPAPNPAEAKPAAKSTIQRAAKAPARRTQAAPKAAAPVETAAQPKAAETQERSSPPTVTPVTLAAYTRKPLGIRLSILKVAPSGQAIEVPPDTTFDPGDRVRLNIQVSDNGYLYIINRGSSGTWTQLFPSPDLPNATNVVVPGTTYSVPPDRNFVVSNPPGAEKLFIILSRTPELDIQSLTMDMSRRDAQNSAPKEEQNLPPHKALQTTIAQNLPPMSDAMVDQMRHVYARDLIIEKVDEQTPGAKKENAVYAVNAGDGGDSRVVLDAQIKH